jgi:hypothetical protein
MLIILAVWKVKRGRSAVVDKHKQKVHETSLSTSGWAQWSAPVIPALRGCTNRRITVQASPGIKLGPYSKNNKSRIPSLGTPPSSGSFTFCYFSISINSPALHRQTTQITKAKRSWGVVQVVEHLPGKHKNLSSYSITARKK